MPAITPVVVLRRSAGDRYSILLLVGVLALVLLIVLVGGFALIGTGSSGAGFLFLVAALMSPFAPILISEARVRWRTRIVIDDQSVRLRLPARRGYVRQKATDMTLPLASIAAIDARNEAFRGVGNTVVQRAYALVLVDGTRIILGADRRFVDPFYQQAAQQLAERARVTVRDLGTVDGHAGRLSLMFWGQRVPPWDAAPLPPARAAARLRQERAAWRLVGVVLAILALIRVIMWFR